MIQSSWHTVAEAEAGDVWAAVVEHPAIDSLERTHLVSNTTISFWLSPEPNASSGRFLAQGWTRGDVRLGRIVVVPGDLPLYVSAGTTPARRMLMCRLPSRVTLPQPRAARPLELCLDMRNPLIATSLNRLAREVTSPGFASAALIEGLGLTIAAELARGLADAPVRGTGGLAGWQLRRIDEHLFAGHWNSSVSDLAGLCGISAAHAMRACRQSTGISLAAYVAERRMARAQEMLADDKESIAEVAALLRFSTPSAFGAAFRRATRETPTRYRQRARGPRH